MIHHRKITQHLLKRQPRRIQRALRLIIPIITILIDLVPSGAEVRRGEHRSGSGEHSSGELLGFIGGDAELAGGGFVGVGCPGGEFGAGDVFGVREVDDGGLGV